MKTLKKMLLWALAVFCVVLAGCADLQITIDHALRYDQCRRMGYSRQECSELLMRPRITRPRARTPEPPLSDEERTEQEMAKERLVINTRYGTMVVYNFLLYPETKVYYDETSSKAMGAFLKQTDEYAINYLFSDQSFLILLMKNVPYARGKAERVLIQKLQTPPDTICLLNVEVHVVGGTNAHPNAMFNYGLSFCPGSTSIRLP